MKKNFLRMSVGFGLCLAAFALSGLQANAQDPIANPPNTLKPSRTKGPFYDHSEGELRMRKLARGIANVGLCVAEVPNQAFREAYKTSRVTGVIVGTGKGLWKGFKRLAIGTWEIATFYAPMKNNYEPYIQPEVVFMEDLH